MTTTVKARMGQRFTGRRLDVEVEVEVEVGSTWKVRQKHETMFMPTTSSLRPDTQERARGEL